MEKRISNLTLKGLNTTMPDIAVPDGACEILHNMRFRDGSWQSVFDYGRIESIPLSQSLEVYENSLRLLYAHEIEGNVNYIAKAIVEIDLGTQVEYELQLLVYVNGMWSQLDTILSANKFEDCETTNISVTHFGKVLLVRWANKMKYFVWQDNKYSLSSMPAPASVSVGELGQFDTHNREEDYTDGTFYYYDLLDANSKQVLIPVKGGANRWWGEVCYLVAYKMKDNTIISPSQLGILCSEGELEPDVYSSKIVTRKDGDNEFISLRIAKSSSNNIIDGSSRLRYFRPSLVVSIPNGIDTNLVDRIAIYSTRINNILDYERMTNSIIADASYHTYYADNKLPNQPMYLIQEKAIQDINNGVWTVELGYDKLQDLTTKAETYKPVQIHNIVAGTLYDYNSRLHYGDVTTTLYSHSPNFEYVTTPHIENTFLDVREYITLEDAKAAVLSQPLISNGQSTDGATFTPLGPIISYPDYRANSLRLAFMSKVNETFAFRSEPTLDFKLKSAPANNFAYYITPPSEAGKYVVSPLEISTEFKYYSPANILKSTFSEPNRIQVSAVNNPFSLPFENSYAVGNEGSRVLAINTVADSLVDSNFYGTYPLYVFTSDGVFALMAGSGNVLYAGTDVVNHDKLLNPNTIAMNGAVVYACSEGLKALTGRQGVRISADIEGSYDWSKMQFLIDWSHNELICNTDNDILLVWNADHNVWSTRNGYPDSYMTFANGVLGNVADDGSTLEILDANTESKGKVYFGVTTRPLKLGSTGFKKLESLIARLASRFECNWTIVIDCSNDLRNWRTMKNVVIKNNTSDIGLKRFTQSARYYRIRLNGETTSKVSIPQIDIVLQDRYNSQLR